MNKEERLRHLLDNLEITIMKRFTNERLGDYEFANLMHEEAEKIKNMIIKMYTDYAHSESDEDEESDDDNDDFMNDLLEIFLGRSYR